MISLLSIIPVRDQASETSEQVTQLLFGEEVEVLERIDNWTQIRTKHDSYVGWVDTKMLSAGHTSETPSVVTSTLAKVKANDQCFNLLLGALLPPIIDGKFVLGDKQFEWVEGDYACSALTLNDALDIIIGMNHSPYLWGGRSPFGIDCSGLSQLFYRLIGQEIPRDASQQIALGDEVFLSEAQAGDLAFFEKNGKVTHVGVLLDNKTIIHASGWVRIDTIDVNGIYVDKTKSYSHDLVGVRRIVE